MDFFRWMKCLERCQKLWESCNARSHVRDKLNLSPPLLFNVGCFILSQMASFTPLLNQSTSLSSTLKFPMLALCPVSFMCVKMAESYVSPVLGLRCWLTLVFSACLVSPIYVAWHPLTVRAAEVVNEVWLCVFWGSILNFDKFTSEVVERLVDSIDPLFLEGLL